VILAFENLILSSPILLGRLVVKGPRAGPMNGGIAITVLSLTAIEIGV
jgi:hypothetical protein